MNKTEKDKSKGGDGLWFERSRHWCQYPIATVGPVLETRDAGDRLRANQEPRKVGSRPRRAARRMYAKLVRYGNAGANSFKGWLRLREQDV